MDLESNILNSGGVKNSTIIEKTGLDWQTWFDSLDSKNATDLSHNEIIESIMSISSVEPWWCNIVAVQYEIQRGLRKKYQKTDGFEISLSKTCLAPDELLYKFWLDESLLSLWLNEDIHFRKCTPFRRIRVNWMKDSTVLDITIHKKGETKSQIVLQHQKIKDEVIAEKYRKFWAESLDKLKRIVEMRTE